MKTKIFTTLTSAFLLLSASSTYAVVMSIVPITSVGTNITNNGTSLVGDVPNSSIGNNSPATLLDWLNTAGSINPGQISQYNTITGSSLPQAVGPNPFIEDGSASMPSYSLTGNFYAVVHYGKGSGGQDNGSSAWYLPNLSGSYSFPANGLGPNALGGISSVRIWNTTAPTPKNQKVPDGGTTIAALGLAMLGLGITRKMVVR